MGDKLCEGEKMNIIEDRIVDLTFRIWHGDYSDLLDLLDASEIKYTKNGKTYNIDGRVRTAIYDGLDPGTIFVCLGFTFFGEFWPEVIGDGMEKVNKRWREEVKKRKGRKGK